MRRALAILPPWRKIRSNVLGKPSDAALKSGGFPAWRQPDGKPVSCVEKIKVLNENLTEIQQMAQDALEDAILMGCDETQVRDVLRGLVESLDNPYRKKL
jgi:hypothetical protein